MCHRLDDASTWTLVKLENGGQNYNDELTQQKRDGEKKWIRKQWASKSQIANKWTVRSEHRSGQFVHAANWAAIQLSAIAIFFCIAICFSFSFLSEAAAAPAFYSLHECNSELWWQAITVCFCRLIVMLFLL